MKFRRASTSSPRNLRSVGKDRIVELAKLDGSFDAEAIDEGASAYEILVERFTMATQLPKREHEKIAYILACRLIVECETEIAQCKGSLACFAQLLSPVDKRLDQTIMILLA